MWDLNSTHQAPWGGFGFTEVGSLVGEEFQLRVRYSHLPDPHSISLSLSHTHTSTTAGLCTAGASISQHEQTPPHKVAEARETEEDAQGGSASICSPGVSPNLAQSRPPRAADSRLTQQPRPHVGPWGLSGLETQEAGSDCQQWVTALES